MRTNRSRTMHTHPLRVFVPLLAALPLSAQLRISEVLIDPMGANAGQQIIEIVNTTASAFTPPAGWTMCLRPNYPAMPQIAIPAGGTVKVHFGATGTNTATDWFVAFPSLLFPDGEFALYRTNLFFDDPLLIVDFVSWGQGQAFTRINTAVNAGIWPGLNAHIAVPAEGHSIAWLGTGTGPAAYFDDGTPTIGAPNRPAVFAPFGAGCAGAAGVPTLAPAAASPLPWLGSTFTLQLGNLPATPSNFGFLVTDFVSAAPQSLAPFGMPGCTSYLAPSIVQLGVGTNAIAFPFAFPNSAAFEGLHLVHQGFVGDATANATGVSATAAADVTLGLR